MKTGVPIGIIIRYRVNRKKCAEKSTRKGINQDDKGLLLLVCVSFTIIGQPRNSVLIRRV